MDAFSLFYVLFCRTFTCTHVSMSVVVCVVCVVVVACVSTYLYTVTCVRQPHYSHSEEYHSESSRGSDLSDILEEGRGRAVL